jgi:GDP-L-fucose synthase
MPTSRPFVLRGARVWVAGHGGMVGSALVKRLGSEKCEILTVGRETLDLTRQSETEQWIAETRPDAIFLAAAKVGGILANETYPADFLYDNLMIQANVLEAAHRQGVRKVLVLGSSCVYPKHAPQPISEDSLLTGALEPTNEAYAVAKIAGLKLARAYRMQYGGDFISAMPTNLYGPQDNFDLTTGHALPALIRKAHEAKVRGDKSLVIWGTGKARREYLHVDDCADALVVLMQRYSGESHVNVGSGEDMTIREIAELVCDVVGFGGGIVCDTTKPDGTPRKLMSGDRLKALGWAPRTPLRDGIEETYRWFLAQTDDLSGPGEGAA